VTKAEREAYEVRKGDVFFTRTSETVEEIGVAAAMLDPMKDTVYSGFVLRARPKDESLDDLFKAYCFSPRYFRQQVIARATYTTRALTNGRSLSAALLARPPMPEQKAIADALSDVDAAIGALSRLIAKKRDLRQGAMQRLLTGQTRLPGFTAPWRVKRLGELVDTDPENLGADTAPTFQFNYIALESVDHGRLLGWSEQKFETAPSRARRRLRQGDVLIATVRPNLQAHLHFTRADGHSTWVCSTGFCVLRCRPGESDPAFVFLQFFGPSIPRQIDALITGSSYPAINSADVRNLAIAVPSTLAEQVAVSGVLSDMDAEIAALDVRLDKTRALKQAMMQALLTGRVRLPLPREAAPTAKEIAYA
jgi:type I restriction enzyme S subunit